MYNRTYFYTSRGGIKMIGESLTIKQQSIIMLSIIFLTISVGLQIREYNESKEPYAINYEYVNIKDMTQPRVATKVSNPNNVVDEFFSNIQNTLGNVEEVLLGSTPTEVNLPATEEAAKKQKTPQRVWYLPTEIGNVTQYPNHGHVAYDITSWRGTGETVHPIANGTISGIYTDSYGALIVTVLHDIDGKKYTSQYVHLSSYAPGLYVGKPVTINDALGQMGSTGWSTGVHLHIAVLDCALFDPSDPNCPDLGAWYRYDKKRYSEDFYGLGVLVYVPGSWNSR